tara:strand:+ start:2831 stop:3217 length:387 start_codon:yes stop_codon:yes gene_type:complete
MLSRYKLFTYKDENNLNCYTYNLNDLSVKKENIIVLNDTYISIDYGNENENLFVRKGDIFRYNNNLIHTHKKFDDNYVDEYKSKGNNNNIKFICNTDSLLITDLHEELDKGSIKLRESNWSEITDDIK